MKLSVCSSFVLALVLATAPADADELFTKSLDETSFGWFSNSGKQQIADDFVLDSDSIIEDITFFGFVDGDNGAPTAFDILIYDDASGPSNGLSFYFDTTAVLNGIDTGLDSSGFDSIFEYSADISDVALSAGTTYWISIRSSVLSPQWAWAQAPSDGGSDVWAKFSDDPTEDWQVFDVEGRDANAFTLNGSTVPEPGSFLVIAICATGTLARRRKS